MQWQKIDSCINYGYITQPWNLTLWAWRLPQSDDLSKHKPLHKPLNMENCFIHESIIYTQYKLEKVGGTEKLHWSEKNRWLGISICLGKLSGTSTCFMCVCCNWFSCSAKGAVYLFLLFITFYLRSISNNMVASNNNMCLNTLVHYGFTSAPQVLHQNVCKMCFTHFWSSCSFKCLYAVTVSVKLHNSNKMIYFKSLCCSVKCFLLCLLKLLFYYRINMNFRVFVRVSSL